MEENVIENFIHDMEMEFGKETPFSASQGKNPYLSWDDTGFQGTRAGDHQDDRLH